MASTLSCGCIAPDPDDYVDNYTVDNSVTDEITVESNGDDDSQVLNTSYHKVTPLFRNIEKENWESILMFLTTGKWSTGMFTSGNEHFQSPASALQVKTWVTSYDRNGQPEWSQLPLHAAISYSAPHVVIQKLVDMYPKSIRCTDNEGMLPIHLAFGFGAPESVLALLLEAFPGSVNEKGLGGRYPYECSELGPNKVRGKVFSIVAEQITQRVSEEINTEWKQFALAAQKSVGLNDESDKQTDLSQTNLTDYLLELLRDRKELQALKRERRHQTKEAASSGNNHNSRRIGSPRGSLTPSSRANTSRGKTPKAGTTPNTTPSSPNKSVKSNHMNSDKMKKEQTTDGSVSKGRRGWGNKKYDL